MVAPLNSNLDRIGEMLQFYGLHENPFTHATPRSIYLGASHRNALATLYYGVECGGAVQALLADRGMGKTTLLRVLQRHTQTNSHTVWVSAADCRRLEFLESLFGYSKIANVLNSRDKENSDQKAETEKKRRIILLVDDAQELEQIALENILSLVEFDAFKKKNLHIVLAGHPELLDKLNHSDCLKSFQQIWIAPLSAAETAEYIIHRLRIVAGSPDLIFTSGANAAIAKQGAGVHQNINNICLKALLTGTKGNLKQVDAAIVDGEDSDYGAILPALEPASAHCISHQVRLLLILSFLIVAGGFWYESGALLPFGRRMAKSESTYLPSPLARSALTNSNSSVGESIGTKVIRPKATEESRASAPMSNVTGFQPANPTTNRVASQATAQEDATVRTSSTPTTPLVVITTPAQPVRSTSDLASVPSEPKDIMNLAKPVTAADVRQARIQVSVGNDFMRLGKYEIALRFYEDALLLSPNNQQIQRKIGRALRAKAAEEQIGPQ